MQTRTRVVSISAGVAIFVVLLYVGYTLSPLSPTYAHPSPSNFGSTLLTLQVKVGTTLVNESVVVNAATPSKYFVVGSPIQTDLSVTLQQVTDISFPLNFTGLTVLINDAEYPPSTGKTGPVNVTLTEQKNAWVKNVTVQYINTGAWSARLYLTGFAPTGQRLNPTPLVPLPYLMIALANGTVPVPLSDWYQPAFLWTLGVIAVGLGVYFARNKPIHNKFKRRKH